MTTPGDAPNGAAGSPSFQAVRTGNAFEETVERILRSVKLGAIRPGERLPPERELAAQLRVSRDTLREAIHALAAEGIVASTRGRSGGTRVLRRPGPLPPERLHDLVKRMPGGLEDALTFRRAVETGSAEAAASRRLDADERRLLTARMDAAEQADAADYRIADTRYHLALADLSGSTQLAAAVAEARLRVNDLLDAIPMLEANLRHSADQHRTISAAVLGGDPEAARLAMAEHLEGTAVLLRGFLDHRLDH
jgi:GntR family transcriptional repressor for pyruvate dehydrogenase complex